MTAAADDTELQKAPDPELQPALGNDPELQKLQAQVAALTEQVRELQRKLEPAPAPTPFVAGPSGPTTTELAIRNLRMSAEAMAPMLDAIPDSLLRQVAHDRPATGPSGMAPERDVGTRPADPEPKQINTSGYRNPRPLKSGLQQ